MKKEYIAYFMNDFYTISSRLNQIRNMPVTFSGGTCVNSAGLSLLNAIASNPGVNMSEICSVLGLTKGAVSQMAAKLQAKKLVEKQKERDNGKEVYLILTEAGKQINIEQAEIRKKMHKGIETIVKGYSDEEIELIRSFLIQISEFMEAYQHEISYRQINRKEDQSL